MNYHQGDIVEVNFLFPNGVQKPHPALIVSKDELYENEEFFYLCLISSKDYNSQYAFAIADDMVTIPFSKPSYVKCQLITGYTERDVVRKLSTMKKRYCDLVIEKVINSIF